MRWVDSLRAELSEAGPCPIHTQLCRSPGASTQHLVCVALYVPWGERVTARTSDHADE